MCLAEERIKQDLLLPDAPRFPLRSTLKQQKADQQPVETTVSWLISCMPASAAKGLRLGMLVSGVAWSRAA